MKKFFILIAYFNKWKLLLQKILKKFVKNQLKKVMCAIAKEKHKEKPTKPVLDKYLASDGTEIFVGKTINKMII